MSLHQIADRNGFRDLFFHAQIHGQILRTVAAGFVRSVSDVAMQRERIDVLVALLEDFAVPLQVGWHEGSARSAGDELKRRIDRVHLPRRVLRLQPVLGGRHVTDLPGTVHLVPQAPVLHFVGLGKAVLAAQVAPLRALLHIAIFHQRGGLFRGSRAQVEAHQGIGADRFAPCHEFIGAKLVGVESNSTLCRAPADGPAWGQRRRASCSPRQNFRRDSE